MSTDPLTGAFSRREAVAAMVLATTIGTSALASAGKTPPPWERGRQGIETSHEVPIVFACVGDVCMPMILDTGCAKIVLARTVSDLMHFRLDPEVVALGFAGKATVYPFSAPALEVLGRKIEIGQAYAADLAEMQAFDTFGLIGVPLFEKTIVGIDAASHTAEAMAVLPPIERALPLRRSGFGDGLRTTRIAVAGREGIDAVVDTGLAAPLAVTKRFLRESSIDAPSVLATLPMAALGGEAAIGILSVPQVVVGSWRHKDVPCIVMEEGFGAEASIGSGLLLRHKQVYDFAHDRMWLEGHRLADTPFRRDLAGVRWQVDGHRLIVREVIRGSAAEAGGLRPGDEVLAENGRSIRSRPLDEFRFVTGKQGETVRLQLDRGRQVEIKLARYY